MAKISIIIPVHNTEKYLPYCLNSVLSQTMTDIEILIIDDASTDLSKKIIKSYQEKFPNQIKTIFLKENVGPGKARNIGLDQASGDYISFIDSDDYIEQTMLEKMLTACEETSSPIARVNHQKTWHAIDCSFLGRNSKITGRRVINPSKDENYLLMETPAVTNKLLRRDLIGDDRFPETIKWEDYPFTTPLLVKTPSVVSVPDTTYFYRVNIKGITCGDLKKITPDILDIFTGNDIVAERCSRQPVGDALRQKIEYIQIQNALQRMRDVLYSKESLSGKKELINLLSALINTKYGPWQENSYYHAQKQSSKEFSLRMGIIENFFLESTSPSMTEEEIRCKIKTKVKDK